MTAMEGIYVSGTPSHPQVRQKLPAPYHRSSITIGAPTEAREWRHVLACDITAGDTVPGIGLVTRVTDQVRHDERTWIVTVEGGHDNQRAYTGTDQVLAFVVKT